jgi:hypothetical protein
MEGGAPWRAVVLRGGGCDASGLWFAGRSKASEHRHTPKRSHYRCRTLFSFVPDCGAAAALWIRELPQVDSRWALSAVVATQSEELAD